MIDPVYQFIKECIAETAQIPLSAVKETSDFQIHLEMDSLEAVEILYKIEQQYQIQFGEVELEELQTFHQIYERTQKLLHEK
ncbi:MAG: acyl carrier protein [Spirochaetes bacterium]|nr:acyl carrier protein [Spirochaetota bacterium]